MAKFLCNGDELEFLRGTRFNDNKTFKYLFRKPLRHRTEVLRELATGKNVLHIGCCDHIPLLPQKIREGTWLHSTLTDVSEKCVGVDIDQNAISQARSISGLANIIYADITDPRKPQELEQQSFDLAIFGEVLEHIGNPVFFLKTFLQNYGQNVKTIIITVPNALRAGNIRNVFFTRETINSDHRFFFTPYTISKVAWDAGLEPISVDMAMFSSANRIKSIVVNRFPLLAENIIFQGCQVEQ
jgi:hypothetical protein